MLSSIVLCNTGADLLSIINLKSLEIKKLLFSVSEIPIGPHSIRNYEDKIITANNYNDSISIFSKSSMREIKNISIGPKPNDLLQIDEKIYIICGESNSIVIYDLLQNRILWEIKTGSWPHSIDYCNEKKLIFVSNLEDNCTNIINIKNYNTIKTLSTPEYPIKIKVSNNKKFIYICESYLGSDENGYLDVFSIDTFKRIARVEVGTSPIDLYEDIEEIYVTNFTEGSISIINKKKYCIEKTLYIGGMPRCILKKDNKLYIGDYLKGRLIILEKNKIDKVIAIDSEPNAMILI